MVALSAPPPLVYTPAAAAAADTATATWPTHDALWEGYLKTLSFQIALLLLLLVEDRDRAQEANRFSYQLSSYIFSKKTHLRNVLMFHKQTNNTPPSPWPATNGCSRAQPTLILGGAGIVENWCGLQLISLQVDQRRASSSSGQSEVMHFSQREKEEEEQWQKLGRGQACRLCATDYDDSAAAAADGHHGKIA